MYGDVTAARNQFNAPRLDCGTLAHSGLIVRLKTGTASIEINAVYQDEDTKRMVVDGQYVKSKIDVWARPLAIGEQFDEIDDDDLNNDKETDMSTALYQTNEEKPRFGTFLTKDSQGRIVLEMKGGGGVEAFASTDVEEVMPYTVAVQQVTDSHNSRVHVELPKGQVVKDDLLISGADGNIYRVVQLDTKSKRASPVANYKFRKLATEPLSEDDGADLIE